MVLALIPALAAALAAAETGAAAGSLRFVDAADAWSIDFRHRHGGQGEFYMIETVGSGVVAFDYDGDGDDDLLFVDSGEPAPHGGKPGRTTLLRNDLGPNGPRFVDATRASGIRLDSYGMGALTGDVDGDGDPDVYLTAFGPNRLWLNRGDGAFSPAPEDGGTADPSWSASAAFGDIDLDGDLDLYVTNYVDFGYDNNIVCGQPRSYCHPGRLQQFARPLLPQRAPPRAARRFRRRYGRTRLRRRSRRRTGRRHHGPRPRPSARHLRGERHGSELPLSQPKH